MKKRYAWVAALSAFLVMNIALFSWINAWMGQPTLDAVVVRLERSGFSVSARQLDEGLLRGRPVGLWLDGGKAPAVLVYRYLSAERAREEAACIAPDASSLTFPQEAGAQSSTAVDWAGPPHFYLYRNSILQYVGSDQAILSALEGLCGKPFAGEGRQAGEGTALFAEAGG